MPTPEEARANQPPMPEETQEAKNLKAKMVEQVEKLKTLQAGGASMGQHCEEFEKLGAVIGKMGQLIDAIHGEGSALPAMVDAMALVVDVITKVSQHIKDEIPLEDLANPKMVSDSLAAGYSTLKKLIDMIPAERLA